MSQYSSKIVTIDKPRAEVFEQLSDLKGLEQYKDRIPQEHREKVSFSEDYITFEVPNFSSDVVLRLVNKNPNRLDFKLEDLPIPVEFNISLFDIEGCEDKTNLSASLNADIPFFLKPMVDGKLQPALDKLAELFQRIL